MDGNFLDSDINFMNIYELRAEVRKLRYAIRNHRDQRGDDRCWMDDHELYANLSEGDKAELHLPPKEEFLANCSKYCERFWQLRQPL